MKKLKIIPIGDNILVKAQKAGAGILDTSSRDSACEYGEVVAVGEEVKTIKAGDKIFFKSWGTDIVNHEEEQYVFISLQTAAVKAILK